MPTFKRAEYLDRQLAWFAAAVAGREGEVELLVSDNCSPDDTPDVCERWERRLQAQGVDASFGRNATNVGAMRNIVGGIERARGRYVWTVGDDDAIEPGALRFVLDTIERHGDLQLLVLNHGSRHAVTGELRYERCFETDEDLEALDGRSIVERFLAHPHASRWGGLVLTTALVYRTDAARRALAAWPEGAENITLQLFITAFCARQGRTILTKQPYMEMAAGRHFFSEDMMVFFRFRIAEVAEAFVKLTTIGYSTELCREKIRNQRKEIRWRRVLGLLRRRPRATLDVLARHFAASHALRKPARTVAVGDGPEATGTVGPQP